MSKKARAFTSFSFVCDGCCKKSYIETVDEGGSEQLILDKYEKIATEFTKLGYTASVRCFCNKCADKEYPGTNSLHHNNFVFSVIRPDRKNPAISFPRYYEFDDTKYNTALAFLKGADTIQKLSIATNTRLNAIQYLKHIAAVLVNESGTY